MLDATATAVASRSRDQGLLPESVNLTSFRSLLHDGTNLLAVQVLNASPTDADLLFEARLEGVQSTPTTNRFFAIPTPGGVNESPAYAQVPEVSFSHERGFYVTNFDLTLDSPLPGARILYTLDGTRPGETNGVLYASPIPISRTTTLRAIAVMDGFVPSRPVTQTYLFVDDVIRQSPSGEPPPGWPAVWGNGAAVNYGMNPAVVDDPAYHEELLQGLQSIPSISVVMDLRDLFDPTSGIYANPLQQGKAWERPVSLEWVPPGGRRGFHVEAGIRIRGGYSRGTGNPKHSFRVFLSPEYGFTQLDYPLFGPTGASSYDKFDIRSMQNDSWHLAGDPNALFIRDPLARDIQLAEGEPSAHGQFCHLYINGQYWGLYTTEERPEAAFGAQYLGGRAGDYDVVKMEAGAGSISANDGTLAIWSNLWARAEGGLASDAAFQRIQGRDPDGTPNPSFPNLLEVQNLIDYMLINLWAGNRDGPAVPNNFFCLRDRNGPAGFRFVVHDSEQTLLDLHDDLTSPVTTGAVFVQSNPARLWQKCLANAEFRLQVADRVQRFFFNGGPMSPQGASALFQARAAEIRSAVVAESARWGAFQASRDHPFTRDRDWEGAVQATLFSYLPQRTAVVLTQLRGLGVWPDIPAPVFSQNGGRIPSGFALTLSDPAGNGTLFYTLDGSDPRLPGGAVSPGALAYDTPVAIPAQTVVKGRIRRGIDWGPLAEALFYPDQDFSRLIATEIMYNPPGNGDVSGDEYEFLELQNRGTLPLDLGGYSFTAGIQATFSNGVAIPPGGFLLLARNPARIRERYSGVTVDVPYLGKLDNGGETLTLSHPLGQAVWSVAYGDSGTWPRTPDGLGFSLVPRDAERHGNSPEGAAWRASTRRLGSPGAEDPPDARPQVVINELRASSPAPLLDTIELLNLSPAGVDITGWFLTDDPAVPRKFRISGPAGQVSPGGFALFSEAEFNPAPGIPPSFGLSARGEEVFLFSADPSGELTGYDHRFSYRATPPGTSVGRYVTGAGVEEFSALAYPTFGAPNAPPALGPVVLGEIHYHPATGYDEYVELHNISTSRVPLYDPLSPGIPWRIAGLGFYFPPGAALSPGSYGLVVGIDPGVFRTRYRVPPEVPVFGPFTGTLQNGGERLELQRPGPADPAGQVYWTVDEVRYDDHAPWPPEADGAGPSLQRRDPPAYGGEPSGWFASGLTPGSPNHLNLPPVARITAPTSGTTLTSPADVWIEAEASDVDGVVTRVEYFADGRKLGETTAPPHRLLWADATGGDSLLTVLVTDDGWAMSRSEGVLLSLSATAPGDGIGLAGEYFDNSNLTSLKLARLDPQIDFHWGTGSPAAGIGADSFSVRWSGQVLPRVTGPHAFQTLSDEGVRLWVDGRMIIDHWTRHEESVDAGSIELAAGRRYDLRLEYYDEVGVGTASLRWAAPGLPPEVIPSSQLFPGDRLTPGPFILSSPFPQVAIDGGSATFTVYAVGTGPLHYQWYRDRNPIAGAPDLPSLTLAKVSPLIAGDYTVEVTDDLGSASSRPAHLTVLLPPGLAYLSPSTGVLAGDELRLEAIASGTPPFGYRWRAGSRLLAPQTNGLLVVTNFQASDAVVYSVVITNVTGLRTIGPGIGVVLLADTDGDRLPDTWERQYGLNPADPADGAGDQDGDGATNRQEYLAGTDPTDPQSVLRIDEVRPAGAGGREIVFRSVPNRGYSVWGRDRLGDGVWQEVGRVGPAASGGEVRVMESTPGPSARYYRVTSP